MRRKAAGLNIRIERTLKDEAEEVIRGLGLTPTEAITLFYIDVLKRGTLPFNFHPGVLQPKIGTHRAIMEAYEENNIIVAKDVESLFDDLRHNA